MKRGFTLVELLVVVVAICLIGSVILVGANDPQTQSPSVADAGVQFPEATAYAIDTANVLTADQLAQLNAKLKTIDTTAGGKQIAVAVIPTTGSLSIEEYGIRLAEKWKVGDAGKDNGVILIVAATDRKLRIEVGSGAEADITDAQAGDIIRTVIGPKLHNGDWFGGITAGVDAINAKLQ